MSRAGRLLAWTATLTVIWVLLVGELTVANVVAGVLAGVVVGATFPVVAPSSSHRLHPLAAVRLAVHVAWSLVTSSLTVAWTVLRPRPERLRSGLVRVELPGATQLIATVVGNSITLTPGTLTVTAEVDDHGAVLHVHVLGLGDIEEFRAGIAALHLRATAALTPRPAPAAAEGVTSP